MVCFPAFGCEPLVAPSGVWMRLSSDLQSDGDEWSPVATITAVFRCNDSDEAWHLLCRGTRWIGHVGNCTATSSSSSFSWSRLLTGADLSTETGATEPREMGSVDAASQKSQLWPLSPHNKGPLKHKCVSFGAPSGPGWGTYCSSQAPIRICKGVPWCTKGK